MEDKDVFFFVFNMAIITLFKQHFFNLDFNLDSLFTYRLVGDNKFYHVANRHVLSKEFSLTGQSWLVVDLSCWR